MATVFQFTFILREHPFEWGGCSVLRSGLLLDFFPWPMSFLTKALRYWKPISFKNAHPLFHLYFFFLSLWPEQLLLSCQSWVHAEIFKCFLFIESIAGSNRGDLSWNLVHHVSRSGSYQCHFIIDEVIASIFLILKINLCLL